MGHGLAVFRSKRVRLLRGAPGKSAIVFTGGGSSHALGCYSTQHGSRFIPGLAITGWWIGRALELSTRSFSNVVVGCACGTTTAD